MATRRFAITLALILATMAGPTLALDFRSLSEAAPAYDAPSAKSKPLSVMLAGTPVEQIVTLEGWAKVRDAKGDLIWIERKFLADKRMVIVRTERAQVRVAADEKTALVFEAERDVVLELLESVPGAWARVRHRDGQAGFVKALQVWGL